MVSFRLFVAGRSMDPDSRHYRCLLPHLEACRMADAALSGVGCVRGVSESGGVVAEPVISRFHPIDHEDIDTHRQCKSFLFSQFLFHNCALPILHSNFQPIAYPVSYVLL